MSISKKATTFSSILLVVPTGIVNGADWATTTSSHFTLAYDQREERLAEQVIGSAEDGLERMAKWLAFRPGEKLRIWLCSTESQFDSLTKSGIPDWGIGCAFPESGTIVLKSPRVVRRNLDLKTIVSHEISHVLLGQVLGDFMPPRWFDEGVAIYQSKEWRLGDGFALGWASLFSRLIPLSELETSFPAKERRANLAYTEGFSAVSFMVREYGEDTLRELIFSVAKQGDFEKALRESFGLRYEEFEKVWLAFVSKNYNIPYLLTTTPLFWAGMALLVLFIFLAKRAKAKRRMAEPDFIQ